MPEKIDIEAFPLLPKNGRPFKLKSNLSGLEALKPSASKEEKKEHRRMRNKWGKAVPVSRSLTVRDVDRNQVERLAMIQCSPRDIAEITGCNEQHLMRTFGNLIAMAQADGLATLRRKQWEVALAGNVQMLIWLGKQHLGQVEKASIQAQAVTFHVDCKEIPS